MISSAVIDDVRPFSLRWLIPGILKQTVVAPTFDAVSGHPRRPPKSLLRRRRTPIRAA